MTVCPYTKERIRAIRRATIAGGENLALLLLALHLAVCNVCCQWDAEIRAEELEEAG